MISFVVIITDIVFIIFILKCHGNTNMPPQYPLRPNEKEKEIWTFQVTTTTTTAVLRPHNFIQFPAVRNIRSTCNIHSAKCSFLYFIILEKHLFITFSYSHNT